MRSNYKSIGQYIKVVDVRNKEDKKDNLLGVSVSKVFIKSIANTVGTDFTLYRVVKKNQFTYIPDTSRRGDKIGLALLDSVEEGLVSQAYTVFEITDKESLLPEYLMMWFRRPEFDRYARYISHGSVREIFSWEDMCNVSLPIPHITKQKEIVKEYTVIQDRIAHNKQLIQKLEETAQAIYKQWFVDFEFPDEEGKPYKSNGGEMVESELGIVPKGWAFGDMSDLYKFQYGMGNSNPNNGGRYPVYGSNGIIGGFDNFNNEDAPIIGHIGENCGSLVFAQGKHYVTYNGVMCLIKNGINKYFGYCTLLSRDLKSQTRGSSQPFVSYDMLYDIQIVIPDKKMLDKIGTILDPIFGKLLNNEKQIALLVETRNLLLSKLATIEN